MIKTIKRINDGWSKMINSRRDKNFSYVGKYRFNTKLFVGFCVLLLAFWVVLAWQNDFNFSQNVFFNCTRGPCPNTLYGKCDLDWCDEKFLPTGFSYGKKPKGYYKDFEAITLLLSLATVIVNHALYNRDFELGGEF